MSHGNVSFLSSFLLLFFPSLGDEYSIPPLNLPIVLSRTETTTCCLRGLCRYQRAGKILAVCHDSIPRGSCGQNLCRSVGSCHNRALLSRTKNFTKEYLLRPRVISSVNMRERTWTCLCVQILSSADLPPAILPVRLTKGPPPGPAYLVCRNNEIMADAPRLTKQCGLFDRCSAVFLPSSPTNVLREFSRYRFIFLMENEERPSFPLLVPFRSWSGCKDQRGRIMSRRDSVFVGSLSSFIMHK